MLLRLVNIFAGTADRHLGATLLLGERHTNTTALLHNVLEDLALRADDAVVELGSNIDRLGHNVELLSLDLQDLVTRSLGVLLSTLASNTHE